MSQVPQKIILKHYGISPWEINVITSILEKKFFVEYDEQENDFTDKFVSFIEIPFPYSFNDEFFKWFEYKEWDRLKGIFKELKRRRGDGKAIKIDLSFSGEPKIRFLVELDEGQWFRTAIEKIDFVVELLQYHLNPEKLPSSANEIIYKFDKDSARWKVHYVITEKQKFVNSSDGWKAII
jgi:hypothetical protein